MSESQPLNQRIRRGITREVHETFGGGVRLPIKPAALSGLILGVMIASRMPQMSVSIDKDAQSVGGAVVGFVAGEYLGRKTKKSQNSTIE